MDRVDIAAWISVALLCVYLAWGIYLLHLRFNRHSEIKPSVEVATLGALVVFYTFEFALLQVWLQNNKLYLVVSTFGLALSGLALYGPMAMSLFSDVVVGMVMPTGQEAEATPHFGAAEQMERMEDYEGAFREYRAIAVAFPNDPTVAARVAESLAKLEQYEEAVDWYERAVARATDPERCMLLTSRIVELNVRHLNRKSEAIAALEGYLVRFPTGEQHERAERRLEKLKSADAGAGAAIGNPGDACAADREPGNETDT